MTRNAEHTPSPQSVVVPVEPTPKMMAATWDHEIDKSGGIESQNTRNARIWTAMLAAAPAPSSLAGGEVLEAAVSRLTCDIEWSGYSRSFAPFAEDIRTVLAALSPEAPAREGVEKACADFQEAIDYFEADVADALAEDSERADLWDREVTVNIDALKTVMRAALTPRHEAPADPCKSCNGTGRELGSAFNRCADCEAPAEGAGEAPRAAINSLTRSVENFDNGYEWGCDPVAVRAILRHLRARSSAPEAREGEAPVRGEIRIVNGKRCRFIERELEGDKWEVIGPAHPAAPSADKLREDGK